MSLILPFDQWPEADRMLWDRAMHQAGPLDDRGRLCHLRQTSRVTLCNHYGRWLRWLATLGDDAIQIDPAVRATTDRLQLWLDDLARLRPMSRLAFIDAVLRLVMVDQPSLDWSKQLRLRKHLKRAAGAGDRSRKQGRVLSSRFLFECGMRHATADAAAAMTTLEAMKRRRNGTMVAFLALVPIRRRAFAGLELGTSFQVMADRIVMSLPGDLTKTGQPWHCEVPEDVSLLVRAYLNEVRPWLMARGDHRHDRLWVGDRGAPFGLNHLGNKIAEITRRLTGVRVSPHLFRDAAATTLARTSPDAARLIRPVLAHSSFGTAERHYIEASSIEAGRNYAELIRRKKGKSR